MTTLSDAELRQAFALFCQTITHFDDFEFVPAGESQQAYASDFAPELGSKLEIFGLMGEGSTIASWQEPGNAGASLPIVLIGSEGIAAVFASSFAKFLSLLPYGMGYIDNILFYLEREQDFPGQHANHFTIARAHAVLAAHAERYADHQRYVDWLSHTAQLAIAPDPAAAMARAYQAHEKFDQWLGDY